MSENVIIFDIGNVLLDFSFLPLQEKLAASAHVPLSDVQAEWSHPSYLEVETGKIDQGLYFDQLCTRLGLPWTWEQWIEEWGAIFLPNAFGQGLYKDLLTQGHRVAMLSNIGPHHVVAIKQRYPDFFNHNAPHCLSFELGFHKPDPRIYHAACHRLDKQPEQCVFLDDLKDNVLGAQSIGMQAMQLTPDNHDEVERFVRSFL